MKNSIFLLMSLFLFLVSCGNGNVESNKTESLKESDGKTCVEILYFHGDMRCRSCVAMEKGVSELLEEQFRDEVKDGKIIFKTIDITTPEGEQIADKYGVSWSSLFLNNWVNGEEERNDLTRFGMKTAAKDREAFKEYIKENIINYLSAK